MLRNLLFRVSLLGVGKSQRTVGIIGKSLLHEKLVANTFCRRERGCCILGEISVTQMMMTHVKLNKGQQQIPYIQSTCQ